MKNSMAVLALSLRFTEETFDRNMAMVIYHAKGEKYWGATVG